MIRAILMLCLAMLGSAPLSAAPATRPAAPTTMATTLPNGDQLRRIDMADRSRSYVLHVPPKHDVTKPAPVVLIFHGAGMNGQMMSAFCGMNQKADDAGFVAVYPNGTGIAQLMLRFNAWDQMLGAGDAPDDVAFTAKVLDDLGTVVAIDPKRVFATGMSNGGFMCYRLAAELSDRIAAIAPVAGTLGVSKCNPKRPVPVIHFHGMDDKIVPYAGSNGRMMKFKGVDESIATFVKIDGCPNEPKKDVLPDKAEDGTKVTRRTYGPGKDGAEVVLYTIEGAGHTWPGQPPAVRFIGKSTKNISANDLIWEFFQKHPMK